MSRVISLGWWLVLVWVQLSAQQSTHLPAATVEKVERAITSEMARQNIPGMSAAIVTDHQLRWSNGFGFSDLENFVPAKASTVYRLGSISKPITAVAVMQLVEQKKLDLDAPVQRYVPSYPQKPWLLAPRHLLSHTGGVRHYRGDEINITKQYNSLTEGLSIFKDDSLLFQPGTRYSYSTYGYNLLGVVVEGASGKSFIEYTREQIFKPAGMDRARDDNVYDIIYNRAYGYRKTQSGELKNSELANTSYKIPGGGFVSTVEDLAKFAIAVQTHKLLKPETTQQMFTPQKLSNGQRIRVNPNNPNNPNVSYGLGWFVNERNGEKEIYHSGGQQRVSTLLYMLPEKKFAVVLMSNLEGAGLMNLAREIADIVLKGK
ncbi:MAG TPA: serine hydrolase domain-containing protein [Bacteroidota bacterium]|nr:serine hydrolase domain-containing protein [Bacteroidota bacterium]